MQSASAKSRLTLYRNYRPAICLRTLARYASEAIERWFDPDQEPQLRHLDDRLLRDLGVHKGDLLSTAGAKPGVINNRVLNRS